jgi:hypothetical protein
VLPESRWAHLSPHNRPRVYNKQLFANIDADPARNKAQMIGAMWEGPG